MIPELLPRLTNPVPVKGLAEPVAEMSLNLTAVRDTAPAESVLCVPAVSDETVSVDEPELVAVNVLVTVADAKRDNVLAEALLFVTVNDPVMPLVRQFS